MALRTTLFALALTSLLGLAGWQLLSGNDAPGPGPADRQVPSQASASDGPAVADSEPVAAPRPAATFPIMRAKTPEEVRQVLRITREATPRDRPALLHAALHAEDPLVCGNALKALGRLKAFTSDEALLALTADPRMRVRQDAVTACGLDGGAAAIPFLEKALAKEDAMTRPLILDALGKIGGPTSRALIQSVASDHQASKTDRVFARAALDRMD